MAKLAVFISVPRIWMTHWRELDIACVSYAEMPNKCPSVLELRTDWEVLRVALHGVVLSESKTPRSRAICSNVIGRKEPLHVELMNQS